jgi:glycosyltransferase involved in cell wall biosynthesis
MSSPVRIVYDGTIFTSQAAGGISRYFRRVIEEVARLRPAWTFDLHIVNDGGTPALLPSGENIRITRRRHFRPAWCCTPLNYGRRQFIIRKAKPTLFHSTLARPFHFPTFPTVVTIHDAIVEKVPEFYSDQRYSRARRWWRWSATHADAVLTVSQTSRADIIDVWSVDPSKVHVTYPGVGEAFQRASRGTVPVSMSGLDRPYLLYVGHRGEHKNFRVLAEAMSDPALDRFDLVLVGGSERVLETPAWREFNRGRLRHLQRVSDVQLCGLYAEAAAVVFPSLYEGFGFPLVEAMSCGAPVVASDIPSSREVCGEAAEFFPSRDAAACAGAILRVQDPERKKSLTVRGMERAKRFTWSSCAQETLRVYEELITSWAWNQRENSLSKGSNAWEPRI